MLNARIKNLRNIVAIKRNSFETKWHSTLRPPPLVEYWARAQIMKSLTFFLIFLVLYPSRVPI